MASSQIVYDCANCLEHYVLWDGKTPMNAERINNLSEIARKQTDEVGTCKKCVRKDPEIPTTLEMDGLQRPDDIINRFYVKRRCMSCDTWRTHDLRKKDDLCTSCNSSKYDMRSQCSIRTWNPATKTSRKKVGA